MSKMFITLFLLLTLSACGSKEHSNTTNSTTDINSSSMSSLEEKVEALKKYMTFNDRNYIAVDFTFWYQNNSDTFLPAPSDWNIQIIAVVPKNELNKWVKEMNPTAKKVKVSWIKTIPTKIQYPIITEWYTAPNKTVGIDRTNNIIVYRNTSFAF